MIKIYAVPIFSNEERQSGVDYARLTLPMTELGKQKGFKVEIFDQKVKSQKDWIQIAKEFDYIYFNYTPNDVGFAIMGCMVRMAGKKLIMDLDDNIWKVLPDNMAYKTWTSDKKTLKNFTAICNEVDYMTTTNNYLRNSIASHTDKPLDKIKVFPNRIDIDNVYTWRKPFKDENNFVIAHFGSTTHFKSILDEEFMAGMDMLMKNYPNVVFKTIGSFMPGYKDRWGQRYVSDSGSPDLMKWIKDRMPKVLADVDFLVVPLTDNVYNRAKSSIKYIETSSCKIPGCYQDIRQYQEVIRDGYNGFLCKNAKDWYKKMKKLIDDKKLRKDMGENAFKTVEEDWQMKNNVKDYIDFFKKIQ